MNVPLPGNLVVEHRLSQNMQGVISYGELQDGVLKNMGDLVPRMTEIAALSTNSIQSKEDRAAYQKEFLNLVNQFNSIQDNSFNGMKLLGNVNGQEKKEFLDSLRNSWLKASVDLIKDKYGWDPLPTDSWDLVVEENAPIGGSTALVRTPVITNTGANQYKANVQKMSFDLADFTAPHTQPQSSVEDVVVHEMVHLLQAQNSYIGGLVGGNSHTLDTCFKEGLVEFIRETDTRINTHPQSGSTIASLAGEVTVGKSWGESSEEHASFFTTISCLDKKIIEAELSDGIKRMTMWMQDQFQGPTKNAAIGDTSNDDFLNDFANTTGGNIFVSNLQTVGAFTNEDIRAIAGNAFSDNPSDGKTAQLVVPHTNGSPEVKYLEALPQAIAVSRTMVGSNMFVVQNGLDSLYARTTSLSQSILQIQDPSYSEEVTNMAKASIRLSFSLSMVEQANQSSSSVVTSLLS